MVVSLMYLAPVEFFALLAQGKPVALEQHERFVKQSYRNRCRILTANGPMDLSIPVEKPGPYTFYKDIRIAEHDNWQQQHWRSITSAYNSSPFLEYYQDDLRPFYEKKWKFLWDFNWQMQEVVLSMLDLEPDMMLTQTYETGLDPDYRELIHPKKEQLDMGLSPYYQVFTSKFGFTPGLSVLDLLLNMGNESILILKNH